MSDREELVQEEKRKSPLSGREIEEASEKSSTSAKVVHEAVRIEGTEEIERPASSLWWSGLAAGLTMGCSMIGQGLLMAELPEAQWQHLVASFGYTLGFLFVTMARQQLFTETTLTAMLPFLHGTHPARDVVRFWAIVFAANMVGTLLLAAAATIPGLFPRETVHAFTKLGVEAVEPGFFAVLIKAVFAGWLIALMVWLMPAASSAKFLVIVAVTWLIAAAKFSHVIAGSIETAFAAMQGDISWGQHLVGFLIPAFIGNSIGGIVFVALLNHAQVKQEI
ncbi:MAG TPA: formate/nitrite transporter family protein [Sphingomicrobium sp.]|jgi:formate/nitrite transporter FocA (FNT family)